MSGICHFQDACLQYEIPVDYKGFDIPNKFVVGYGLDFADRFRTLPYVAELKKEAYS